MPVRYQRTSTALLTALACTTITLAHAHGINSKSDGSINPAFDIKTARATTDGRLTTFAMELAGAAGSVKPTPIGQLTGAKVEAYVWPTSLDPAKVGFDAKSGILALAITAHPDFDDTPLFDENGDGDPANDGAGWHSHWVVLVEEKACGAGLKVRDVSPGVDLLPATAPPLPFALDSPGMIMNIPGVGSQYLMNFLDGTGDPYDGSKTYKVTLPKDIPAEKFWSFTLYDNQTRSELQTDNRFPGIDSNKEDLKQNEDGSYDIYFGPTAPDGQESNWLQTIPEKGWNTVLRIYGPGQSWFDKTWRPGDPEVVN